MKLKKFASFLGFVLTLCFAAGCAQSAPPEPGFDAADLPFYVEDTDSLNYSYTARERIQPFWQGNVIYNEQIMVVKKDGKTEGRLLYDAKRVISVRDWTLEKEYEAGKDYMIEGDTITLPAGSSIPVFDDEWSRGVNVPEVYPEGNAGTGYVMIGDGNSVMYTETGLIYKNYIHVTYVYDPAAADRSNFKKFSDELYGLSQKIGKKEDIEMVVFGDSISEGHSSSELWGHAPYSPPYAKLVKEGLELFGGVKVGYENISKGGMDSSWAADEEQLAKLTSLAPDLLLVAFGTNDSLNNLEGKTYRANIEKIIETAKAAQQRMSDPSHCALSVQRKGEIRAQPRTHLPYVAKHFGELCGEKHTRRGVREPVRGRARYARNEKLLRSGGKQRQPSQRFYSPLLCDEYTERDIRF